VLSEFGPRKKRETEIDRGGVQSVGGLIQLHSKGIVDIKTPSAGNKNLGKVCIDAPIPYLVGMSQSIARDFAPDTHVVEFLLGGAKTGLDVP